MPQVEALCNIGGGKIYADRLPGAAGGKFGVAVAKQFAQIVEILAGAVEEIEISADGFDTFKFGIAAEKRAQRLCDCIRARAQRFGKPKQGRARSPRARSAGVSINPAISSAVRPAPETALSRSTVSAILFLMSFIFTPEKHNHIL